MKAEIFIVWICYTYHIPLNNGLNKNPKTMFWELGFVKFAI